MEPEKLKALIHLSKSAARKAGRRIMEHYGGDFVIYDKAIGTRTGDVVTQADHDAQDIIFEELDHPRNQHIMADIAVLAEEMEDHGVSERFEKPFTMVIDPMDGTRGFIDHTNSFAVSIGLVARDGTPIFGVAYLPALDIFAVGIHQTETAINGKSVRFESEWGDRLTMWLSEAEFFPSERNAVWHSLSDVLKAECGIHRIYPVVVGSPVHKGCNLLTHQAPSLYVGLPRREKGVSLWDLAAIASIVSGAGGWVSDLYGEPLELNRKESTFAHHRGFVFATHAPLAKTVIRSFQEHYGRQLF